MSLTVKPQDNFPEWYQQVVLEAGLADNSPVRGCMVIKPYGYAIWQRIQSILDGLMGAAGVQNAYFPLLIPESFLRREAEHVEGFAPEVAVVTHAGGALLPEPLVIRPTSETIIYATFAKWIQSWRDLPLLINQWANVVRWEMRPRLFLRTSEFLWQEGHTAHATSAEADAEVTWALAMYQQLAQEHLAMHVIPGRKTEGEKFAGADYTTTIEALMRDGKALQMCTSHGLGQNFARAFEVQFTDAAGQRQFVWQTSWGLSTRLIGALVMAHGDERGLRLPPSIAPVQVVVVPIAKGDGIDPVVAKSLVEIREQLVRAGVRFQIDDRPEFTPGWKFNEWELKGVPLRLEIGPREAAASTVSAVRRAGQIAKVSVPIASLCETVPGILVEVRQALLDEHRQFTESRTVSVASVADLLQALEAGNWAKAWWDGNPDEERQIKEQTKATIRCIPFAQPGTSGCCLVTGRETARQVIFARAY